MELQFIPRLVNKLHADDCFGMAALNLTSGDGTMSRMLVSTIQVEDYLYKNPSYIQQVSEEGFLLKVNQSLGEKFRIDIDNLLEVEIVGL